MHKSIFTLTAVAAALMASGLQAKSREAGPQDKRQVVIGSFDRIAVAGPFLVRVSTGDGPDVRLSGPRTMLADTEIFVRDGQLVIRWQEGASWSRNGSHGVDIDIKVPSLREATMYGAGSIDINRVHGESFGAMLASSGGIAVQKLDVKRFEAKLAGSGSLRVGELDADAADVLVAGSGAMRATGTARTATLKLFGSSAFNNPDLSVREATIFKSGPSTVRLNVTEKADVQTAGPGEVVLTGGGKYTVSELGPG
jgi:hypothetical protein